MKRLLLLILLIMGTVGGQTIISDCAMLSTPGEYYMLDADIFDTMTDPCIEITANNIEFDCSGFTIDSDGSAGHGIEFSSVTGVTIHHCTLTDWDVAPVYVGTSDSNTIRDLTISTSGSGSGIYLAGSDSNTIRDITISGASDSGIYFASSDSNSIYDVTISSCGYGLRFDGSKLNTVYDSKISSCSTAGLYFQAAPSVPSNITLYNNLLNNTNNSHIESGALDIFFNTTLQTGTRIVSLGPNIAGNYWTNSTGTGYSDTCVDTDTDGFCDTPLNLSVGAAAIYDYLPLSDKYASDVTSPNITVHYPTPNVSTRDGTPTWNFTVVDDQSATLNCTLHIDGAVNINNGSVLNGTVSYLTPTSDLDLRWRAWNLTCLDSAGNANSETSYIQIRNYRFLSAMSAVTICGFIFRARRGRRYR
jgi:parallel beta-helix repeat protein